MKFQETFRAIALKPFMICGEVAHPGEEVELLSAEFRSLKFNGKIRPLSEKELTAKTPDEDERDDDKKDKK